jgi:hypothetical protein
MLLGLDPAIKGDLPAPDPVIAPLDPVPADEAK